MFGMEDFDINKEFSDLYNGVITDLTLLNNSVKHLYDFGIQYPVLKIVKDEFQQMYFIENYKIDMTNITQALNKDFTAIFPQMSQTFIVEQNLLKNKIIKELDEINTVYSEKLISHANKIATDSKWLSISLDELYNKYKKFPNVYLISAILQNLLNNAYSIGDKEMAKNILHMVEDMKTDILFKEARHNSSILLQSYCLAPITDYAPLRSFLNTDSITAFCRTNSTAVKKVAVFVLEITTNIIYHKIEPTESELQGVGLELINGLKTIDIDNTKTYKINQKWVFYDDEIKKTDNDLIKYVSILECVNKTQYRLLSIFKNDALIPFIKIKTLYNSQLNVKHGNIVSSGRINGKNIIDSSIVLDSYTPDFNKINDIINKDPIQIYANPGTLKLKIMQYARSIDLNILAVDEIIKPIINTIIREFSIIYPPNNELKISYLSKITEIENRLKRGITDALAKSSNKLTLTDLDGILTDVILVKDNIIDYTNRKYNILKYFKML